MTKTILLGLVLAAAPMAAPLPAFAQNAAQNGVLVIYGEDKCPTNADGDEIVICVRRPAEERFRIPKELRDQDVRPQNQSWAVRQQDALGDALADMAGRLRPAAGEHLPQSTADAGDLMLF